MKGKLGKQGQRHTLRFERTLRHSAEKVWLALTEDGELSHWFPARIAGARALGAKLRFVFPEQESKGESEMSDVQSKAQDEHLEAHGDAGMEGEVTVFDPPRIFEFTWHTELLRFELEPVNGGTRLVFTHTFDEEPTAARNATGWDVCFEALERRLNGEPPVEHDVAHFDALFAEYAEAFGPRASASKRPGAAE
jgi:uncharacterized protein YndB with AHSA1/START domain